MKNLITNDDIATEVICVINNTIDKRLYGRDITLQHCKNVVLFMNSIDVVTIISFCGKKQIIQTLDLLSYAKAFKDALITRKD